jgi:tRNA(Ile)-lysidine synthase
MGLTQLFEQTLSRFDVLKPDDTVVLGVSGGPDSLVLLHLFAAVRERLNVRPVVFHLDHQIRGEEAEADARFVEQTSKEWGIPVHVERIDVPTLAAERRLSLEEAARMARYTALGQYAVSQNAGGIAVAHNADDQAETVLMHLIRGAGLLGLRGMLPVSHLSDYHLLAPIDESLLLIRPLLEITRADIEAYCIEHGLSPRFDRSNLDTTYFRNRLRHEIIPQLETVNPNIRVMLTRTASVMAAYHEFVKPHIDTAWDDILLELNDTCVQFDLEQWRALPLAIQRATIRRASWHLRKPLRDIGYQHVEDAVDVAQRGETGAQATLPGGLILRVDYDSLVIAAVDQQPPAPDWPLLAPNTVIPAPDIGEYLIPGSEWTFSLSIYDGPRSGPVWKALLADPWKAPFDAGVLSGSLHLRTRRPGDRLFPSGLGGTMKLSAFMINEKIPAAWRDHLPLLVTGDHIVWVCGWRVDERFAVHTSTDKVWLAAFSHSGED